MILSDEEAALFYRAWGALLTWANDRRKIVPPFPRPTPGRPIDPQLATQIRDVVWAEDTLREQFLAEGATDLGAAERDLIASWKHRVRGSFVIYNHLQKHSIFMSDAVYGVRGIYTPLEVMFPCVPIFVEAVLIPFRDVIITDGLLQTPPMHMTFGGGIRRMFKGQYSAARAAGEVRMRLPWQAESLVPIIAAPRSTGRRGIGRRAPRSRSARG
jgi:hypothetical protein